MKVEREFRYTEPPDGEKEGQNTAKVATRPRPPDSTEPREKEGCDWPASGKRGTGREPAV